MSDIDPFKSLANRAIELEKEVRGITGVVSAQSYIASQEAKEIRIYPEGTAPRLEEREDGVLYFCETEEDTGIDPMKILMGRGIEVLPNDVSYGKMPLNEGSWGKRELFAPKKSEEEEEKPEEPEEDGLVLVCKIPSANYTLDLSPWLSAAPGDGTTDISIDWGDNASAVSNALALSKKPSLADNFEVYTVEEREDEPVIEEDERHVEQIELDSLMQAKSNLVAISSVDYPVVETPGTGTIIHTYATAGEYRITLKGSFKWGLGDYIFNTSLQVTLTAIELPSGKSPIKYVASCAFYNCNKLTSIPEGLFDNCTAVTSFTDCFPNCSALTSIPEGLFDKCTEVTTFQYCFYNCSALTNIPAGLFDNCTKVTSFNSCFAYCRTLTSIPVGLFDNCHEVTDFSNCFNGCSAFTSIPVGLFDNCPAVTIFSNCFSGCSTLTSIPQGLFGNCTKVTTFNYCFSNCSALTSTLPTLWISHSSASHFYCFFNCTKATNYAAAQAAGWA